MKCKELCVCEESWDRFHTLLSNILKKMQTQFWVHKLNKYLYGAECLSNM